MKNVLVRADSSSLIGIGHIMRDLVLIKQHYAQDNVIFACQNLDGNINQKITEVGYVVKTLSSNNIEELNTLIASLKIDLLIIDHYDINDDFEKQLKMQNPKLQILSFDDTYEKHCCDILLNHNIYAQEKRYKNLVPKGCELRCGKEYMLIRDEFKHEKEHTNPSLKEYVILSMGGADHQNLNIKILNILNTYDNLKVKVVTTKANAHLQELLSYANKSKSFEVIIESNEMAKLFNNAHFAIVTSSTVASEVMYLNVPFIAIKTAPNQTMMYEYLKENDYNVLDGFNEPLLKEFIDKLLKK